MKPIKSLISFQDAMFIMMENVIPIEATEFVMLEHASGRVLSEDIVATVDVPHFSRAAMDGYAVYAEDTFEAGPLNPVMLKIVGAIHAGEVFKGTIPKGHAVQVATGSPIPEGTDAVVMVEDTEREGDWVRIYKKIPPSGNLSPAGSDIKKGDLIVKHGTLLNPAKIGAIAAVGLRRVPVFRKPQVAIISTGNEIVEPGERLGDANIYDVNSFTISSLVNENGGEARIYSRVPDEKDEIIKALNHAQFADIVIITGGSSVGERDILIECIKERGRVLFHGIAVKPGKPTIFGLIDGKPVFGLPGNPTSCLTNSYAMLIPVLRKIGRLPEKKRRIERLPISRRVTSTIGRHQLLPIRVENGQAHPCFKESGAITSMSVADGYIEIPSHVDLVEKGEIVEVIFFD